MGLSLSYGVGWLPSFSDRRPIAEWVRNLTGDARVRFVARLRRRAVELAPMLENRSDKPARQAVMVALFLEYADHVGVDPNELFSLLENPRAAVAEALPALAVAEMVTRAEKAVRSLETIRPFAFARSAARRAGRARVLGRGGRSLRDLPGVGREGDAVVRETHGRGAEAEGPGIGARVADRGDDRRERAGGESVEPARIGISRRDDATKRFPRHNRPR